MPDLVDDWVRLVHRRWPPAQAADWDAVGLQIGDPAWVVERVLVSLDITGDVVAEAAAGPPTLLLAHHPVLFRPLPRLTPEAAPGRIALAAAQAGVAVLAAHTNLDVARDGTGTSDPVVRLLDASRVVPLTHEVRDAAEAKLVTFVPGEHRDAVLDALADAGAGVIGDYERCSFRTSGTGTFRPGVGTDPFSGAVGEENEEQEERLEIVVPRRRLGAAVRALLGAHPYEEVAYDLYPLLDNAEVGFGRIADLRAPTTLRDLARLVREELPAPHLRSAGSPATPIARVAVVGGSGMSLADAARSSGADVLITGDVKHHDVLDALETGLAVIDAGHHATEVAALGPWIDRLRVEAADEGLEAQVVASATDTDPWNRPEATRA
jgi:dinuclear metal center YbgI/SA1388 family protein